MFARIFHQDFLSADPYPKPSLVSFYRVDTAPRIWVEIFSRQGKHGNLLKILQTCFYIGNLPLTQGKFWSFKNQRIYNSCDGIFLWYFYFCNRFWVGELRNGMRLPVVCLFGGDSSMNANHRKYRELYLDRSVTTLFDRISQQNIASLIFFQHIFV